MKYKYEPEWTADSREYAKELSRQHFGKMYPDAAYEGKYVLWLTFGLFLDTRCNSIRCQVQLLLKDGTIRNIQPLRVRHPYKNRSWYVACMKSGIKVSNAGIVLPFDSFEDLCQVSGVRAYWSVESEALAQSGESHICVCYDLSFERAQDDKKSYCVISLDTPTPLSGIFLSAVPEQDDKRDTYDLEEYSAAFILNSVPCEKEPMRFSIDEVKGPVESDVAMKIWFGSPDTKGPDFRMECYYSHERLVPMVAHPIGISQ